MMTETKCLLEQFRGRIIFMSMYNDIVSEQKRKQRVMYCEFPNCSRLCEKYSRTVIGRFFGLDQKKGTEHIRRNQMESGTGSLKT